MSDKKLSDRAVDFLRLVRRSESGEDRWARVSKVLRVTVDCGVAENPEFYETKEEDGRLMIRLSHDGSVIGRYL